MLSNWTEQLANFDELCPQIIGQREDAPKNYVSPLFSHKQRNFLAHSMAEGQEKQ